MPDIMHVVTIHASPARIYEALTTTDGIRHWWTRDAVLDDRVGGSGEFGFGERQVVTRVSVDALEPHALVAWTIVASSAPAGWQGTTISFDLRPEASTTVLTFAHRGFERGGDDYDRVAADWSHDLARLKSYLETGNGLPR